MSLINLAHLNRFHPVREWLDSKTWDRVPRIDNWLRDYGGADDTPFNRAVGQISSLPPFAACGSPESNSTR